MEENIDSLEGKLYASKVPEPQNQIFLDPMTDWYFKPKSFEKDGTLYRALGIKTFKKIVKATFGRGYDRHGSNYYIGDKRDRASIKKWELRSRINELAHTSFATYLGYGLIQNLSEGNIGDSIICGLGLLINGYCSMLQRYNRARAYCVMEKLEERAKNLSLS